MWQKAVKKTIFTLNLNNYAPDIIDITYPFIKQYAYKIGADFYEIKDRKFPDFPPTYEKLQIYELAQQMENDWNLFFDCDALIHPDLFDVTCHIPRDTVAHNGADWAGVRWKYDRFFMRDGRNIGSCTWIIICSDWTIEVFKPLDDITLEDVKSHVFPIVSELQAGVTSERLIEDYVCSRNIAKYGLKFYTLMQMFDKLGMASANFFWHAYAVPNEEKIIQMKQVLKNWGLVGNAVVV